MSRQTCTDHCGGCGRHFHSLAAFDCHRVGGFEDPADPRRCADPATEALKLQIWTQEGYCDLSESESVHPVVIWQMVPNRSAQERFARLARERENAVSSRVSTPGSPERGQGDPEAS